VSIEMVEQSKIIIPPADLDATALSYLRVFVDHLVQKFRQYNSDEFTVCISGADGLIQEDDVVLRYLLEQLR